MTAPGLFRAVLNRGVSEKQVDHTLAVVRDLLQNNREQLGFKNIR
jgi:hypothetical protein